MSPGRCELPVWLVMLFLLLAAGRTPSHGHGLGVDRVFLEELTANRYRISFKASAEDTEALGLPILPAHCQWVATEKRPSADAGLVFTSRERPLTAEDNILLPWRSNGVLVTVRWQNGSHGQQFFMSGEEGITVEMAQLKAESGSPLRAATRYTRLGIEHILTGVDHLFFVVGLLLLIKGWKRLAWSITAFTVAHSLTLALAVLGLVHVPSSSVEALIALSIVLLALENVRAQRGQDGLTARWPWLVSFGFGLFHGLGFASALNGLGLSQSEIPLALLFFNVGVELGQIVFVALCLGFLQAFRALGWRVPKFASQIPGYGLGIASTYWFAERVLAMFGRT